MYCTVCGKENAPGARFCSHCGAASATTAGAGTGYAYAPPAPPRPLVRPRANRMLAGVCAAFAAAYGWDLALVRVIAVFCCVLLIPFFFIGYLAAWALMPEEPLIVPAPPPANP